MEWEHGSHETQEYWYVKGHEHKFQVVRNLIETHWVIYEFVRGGVHMVPNPYRSRRKLRFAEVTDIPKAGEQFGDRPHHDTISAYPENHAWDDANAAKQYTEKLLGVIESDKLASPDGPAYACLHVPSGQVMVVCADGRTDFPIRYKNGSMAWDNPESVPQYARDLAYNLMSRLALDRRKAKNDFLG